MPAKGKKTDGVWLKSLVSSLECPDSAGNQTSPRSPPDSKGWQKPAKVACRHSPDQLSGCRESADLTVEMVIQSESVFSVLADPKTASEGRVLGLAQLDLPMFDSGSTQGHLKRAHNPGPKRHGLGSSGPKLVDAIGFPCAHPLAPVDWCLPARLKAMGLQPG